MRMKQLAGWPRHSSAGDNYCAGRRQLLCGDWANKPPCPATPALYRVQGFDVALENRPEGIIATVVDVPGVTATADTRSEVLNLIREQLAPFWKPSPLD